MQALLTAAVGSGRAHERLHIVYGPAESKLAPTDCSPAEVAHAGEQALAGIDYALAHLTEARALLADELARTAGEGSDQR